MPRSKSTIARDSVFRFGGSPAPTPRQGIEIKETPRHQASMWLTDAELEWLDEQVRRIHRGGWRTVTRSAFLRALIQATMDQPLELEGVSGEGELTERLKGGR